MDIGNDGDYPMVTFMLDNLHRILRADLTQQEYRLVSPRLKSITDRAIRLGWKKGEASNEVRPDNFLKLFELLTGPDALNIDAELSKMITKVGERRKSVRNKRKADAERLGISTVSQYS